MSKKGEHHHFSRAKCICCDKMLSNNARGRASHMRAHVRDKEAKEISGGRLHWEKINE